MAISDEPYSVLFMNRQTVMRARCPQYAHFGVERIAPGATRPLMNFFGLWLIREAGWRGLDLAIWHRHGVL